MINLKFEHDYVIGDTDDWLDDITDENDAAQEAFDKFLTYLGPVMEELGIELAQPPTIMPIVDLVQQ